MSTHDIAETGRRSSLHGHWSSRLAFVLAVTGSAVGIGNIWKFPYMAGANGGGAFVVVYLLCAFLIGLPVMMSEILLGRRGRRNPVATMALLGEEEGSTRQWRWVGALGVVAGLLILSYYSVVAGWTLAYSFKSASGEFVGVTSEEVGGIFSAFTGNWVKVAMAHTAFMAITTVVIARGVERGLEQAVRFMVPALLALMLVLLAYSLASGSFAAGVKFLFQPDFAALGWGGALAALGQAFFSLSIGMGAVMAYGAYLPEETSITGAATTVVVADSAIAILAGLIIFPIVFANALDPAEGPGLVFNTLPVAFGDMPFGTVFGTIFFVLLVFAAWTSALGLMEPSVAWLIENFGYGRNTAAAMIGGLIWLLGFGTVLSFNELSEVRFLWGTIYDNVDYITSNIMLPLAGVVITVFAAWIMCRNSSAEELGGAGTLYQAWRFLARYVAPVGILFVFLQAVGVL
ncbi:MAG: sodium-dependent transporter [Woeseiaceae bacterium]|nr:sodium-dependent transporter [Woeseiaceae bacterium]